MPSLLSSSSSVPGFLIAVSHEELPTFKEQSSLERRRASKRKAPRPLNWSQDEIQPAFHDPKVCGGVSNHVSLLLHSWFHPRAGGVVLSLDPEELPIFEISSVIFALPYNFPPVKTFCANLHSLQPLVSPMTSFILTSKKTEALSLHSLSAQLSLLLRSHCEA